MTDLRTRAREMAKRSIVTEATARLVEQVLVEANAYHAERITRLENALREASQLVNRCSGHERDFIQAREWLKLANGKADV